MEIYYCRSERYVLNKGNIKRTLFFILILTYVHVIHGEGFDIYGFPLGYVTIYHEATATMQ